MLKLKLELTLFTHLLALGRTDAYARFASSHTTTNGLYACWNVWPSLMKNCVQFSWAECCLWLTFFYLICLLYQNNRTCWKPYTIKTIKVKMKWKQKSNGKPITFFVHLKKIFLSHCCCFLYNIITKNYHYNLNFNWHYYF